MRTQTKARRLGAASPGLLFSLTLLTLVAVELFRPAPAGALPPPVAVRNYELVSQRRIDRTRFEYTYAAWVSNWDDQDVTVSATLVLAPANVVIVEGALDFGSIAQGGTVRSIDTFTIQHTRDVTLEDRSLVFDFQITPAPLTTYQKIDAAAQAGTIDDETALVYKVFADFDDPRLPAVLLGRDDPGFDGSAIGVAADRLATLSQATQALLAPFLMRPDEPGSWVDWQPGGAAPALASNAAGGSGGAMAAAATTPTCNTTWCRIPVTIGGGTKAWIWWRQIYPGDSTVAEEIKTELEGYLWNKLTGAFRVPIADDVIPGAPLQPNPNAHGPDGALDFYLTRVKRSMAPAAWNACSGLPIARYVLLQELHPGLLASMVAHEMMHAITASYPRMDCIERYAWLDEATATWAMHFAYDGPPATSWDIEHVAAAAFLRKPLENPFDPAHFPKCVRQPSVVPPAIPDTGEPLDLHEGLCGLHQYGAYLWFLNLTEGRRTTPAHADRVEFTWINASSHLDIFAVNATAGGFTANWQTFLANNWNGDPEDEQPHRDYVVSDELEQRAYEQGDGVVEVTVPPYFIAIDPIVHQLPPLAAQYNHFDFTKDPKIRQVWFYNDYAGIDPRANVGAIVKVEGTWKRVADWSNDAKRVFCRDKSTEDIQELVLIVSNLDLDGAQNPTTPVEKLGGPDTRNDSPIRLVYSPVPCHDWTGTVDFQTVVESEDGQSVTTTSNATNVRFRFDAATTDPYLNAGLTYFDVVQGDVAWQETAIVSECTDPEVGGAFPAAGQMIIAPTGLWLTYQLINIAAGSYDETLMFCTGGPSTYGRHFSEWLPTPSSSFHPTTNIELLEGGEEYGNSPGDGWSWTFVEP